MDTLNIFPVNIFTFDWGGDLDDILERAILKQKSLGMKPSDVSQSDSNALRLFPELLDFIDDCLSQVKDCNNLQCDGLKVSSSWINRYVRYSVLPWHRHPMSAFSGTFFLNASGRLSFKDPILFRSNESIMPFSDDPKQYDVETKPGRLVIFPWWLEHGAINEDSVERWSLSFNSIPYGTINTNLSSATLEIK